MSKKVLMISTSPRKGGNSDVLADEFARGAREAGNHVEKVANTITSAVSIFSTMAFASS